MGIEKIYTTKIKNEVVNVLYDCIGSYVFMSNKYGLIALVNEQNEDGSSLDITIYVGNKKAQENEIFSNKNVVICVKRMINKIGSIFKDVPPKKYTIKKLNLYPIVINANIQSIFDNL